MNASMEKNHFFRNSLDPLESVITIFRTIGFVVQDPPNARPIHACAGGDNRGSRCADIGDLCERKHCKGVTRKLKFMRNKSKNGNVKNCPLKNKTPRGQEKKEKEKERNHRTRMLIVLPSLEE